MASPEHMSEKNAGQQGLLTKEIQEFLGNEGRTLADNLPKTEKKLKQREAISPSSASEDGPITKSGGSIADRVRSLQESTGGAIGTTSKRISLPAVPKTPLTRSPAAPNKPQLPKLDNASILTPTSAPSFSNKVSPLLPSTMNNVASPPPPLSAKPQPSPKVDGFSISSQLQTPSYPRSQAQQSVPPQLQPQPMRAAPSLSALAASLSSSSAPSSHPPSPSANAFALTSPSSLPPTSSASAQFQPLSSPVPIPLGASTSTSAGVTAGGGIDADHAFVPASALGPPSPSSTPASSPQATNFSPNDFNQHSAFNLKRDEAPAPASSSTYVNGSAQPLKPTVIPLEPQPVVSPALDLKQPSNFKVNGTEQSTEKQTVAEPQSAEFNLSQFNQDFPDLEDFESQHLIAGPSFSATSNGVGNVSGLSGLGVGEVNMGGGALNSANLAGSLKPADTGSTSSIRSKSSLTKLQNGLSPGSSSLATGSFPSPTSASFPVSPPAASTSSFQHQQALSPTPLSPPSSTTQMTLDGRPPLPNPPIGNAPFPPQTNGYGNFNAAPPTSGNFSPPSGLSLSPMGMPGPGPSSAAYRPFSASLGRSLDRPSSTPITPSAPAFISRSPSPSGHAQNPAGAAPESGEGTGDVLRESAPSGPPLTQGQGQGQSQALPQVFSQLNPGQGAVLSPAIAQAQSQSANTAPTSAIAVERTPSQSQPQPQAQSANNHISHLGQSPSGVNGASLPQQTPLQPAFVASASSSSKARAQVGPSSSSATSGNASSSSSGMGMPFNSGPSTMGPGSAMNGANGFVPEHRASASVDQAFGGHSRTPAESSTSYTAANGANGALSRRPAIVNRAPSNNTFSPSPLSPPTSTTPQSNGYGHTGPITYPSVHRRTSTQVLTNTGSSSLYNTSYSGSMSPLIFDPSSSGPLSPPPIAASPSSLNSYRHSTRGAEPAPLLSTSSGGSVSLRGAGSSTATLVEYPSVPRPPPPAAASPLAERQDNRPRQPVFTPTAHVSSLSYSAVPNGGYFGSAPNQAGANGTVARTGLPNGLIQPPRIKSDYPVTYFGDVHIATTGLKNLGNTCYMNATIQCLSATVPFARFFNDGRWRNAINYTNAMGTKGAFASAFSVIIHDLWHGDLPYITPLEFRKSMGSHKSLYATADQQDSQEFLSFLLDGIHEDLNRVISKPNWTDRKSVV